MIIMTNKQAFVKTVAQILNESELSEQALAYWRDLKKQAEAAGKMTESGRNILECMQSGAEDKESFTAKEIGEALQVSGRSVSGSIRKLIQDGLVEKVSQEPVAYGLTAAGKEYQFDD